MRKVSKFALSSSCYEEFFFIGNRFYLICLSLKLNIYIYRERERWVQVTPGVTLKSYTFSKQLYLSRFNGKKRHSLILIFWLVSH